MLCMMPWYRTEEGSNPVNNLWGGYHLSLISPSVHIDRGFSPRFKQSYCEAYFWSVFCLGPGLFVSSEAESTPKQGRFKVRLVSRMECLRLEAKRFAMLMKWLSMTRLETRTKESNIYASIRVFKTLGAQRK